eukprot:11192100-Lingulodinium_polyedra.AAC.1
MLRAPGPLTPGERPRGPSAGRTVRAPLAPPCLANRARRRFRAPGPPLIGAPSAPPMRRTSRAAN